MGKLRLFVDNFLIYGLGNIVSKIVPMLMVPVLTRIYPNSEYFGINDLSTTIISFAGAVSLCGMYDALFRLYFDKEDSLYKKSICSTALFFVLFTTIAMSLLLIVFRNAVAVAIFGSDKYEVIVILTAVGLLSNNMNSLLSAPTRMENKRSTYLIVNIASPLISYSIAMLLVLHQKYIIAMPLATALSGLFIDMTYIILNKKWFSIKLFKWSALKDLLSLGIFFMPNFFIYWVYNSADRLMIGKILGNEYVGLYSVAAKMGGISNLLYTAFASGWLYFSYSVMKSEDNTKIKSDLYEFVSAIIYLVTICFSLIIKPVWNILFPLEYQSACTTSIYLFLAPMMLMLFQIIGNQFTVVKRSYMNFISLSIGAVINVVLNYYLIKKIGIEGAAIATISGYTVNLLLAMLVLGRYKLLIISQRNIKCVITFGLYMIGWRFINNSLSIFIGLVCVGFICRLYEREIKEIVSRGKRA